MADDYKQDRTPEELEEYAAAKQRLDAGDGTSADAAYVKNYAAPSEKKTEPKQDRTPAELEEYAAARKRLDAGAGSDADAAYAESYLGHGKSAAEGHGQKSAYTANGAEYAPAGGVQRGPAAGSLNDISPSDVQASPGSRWEQLTNAVRQQYPGIGKAADAVSAMGPALAVTGGGPIGALAGAATMGNAPTGTKKDEEAKGPDAAQEASDRAKAIAAQSQGQGGGIVRQFPEEPARTIPAHWQDSSKVIRESPLTPEDAEAVRTGTQAAGGLKAEGLEHAEAAAAHQAVADAAYNRWRNEFERQNTAELQKANAERDRVTNQRLAAMDESLRQYDVSVRKLGEARKGLFANQDTATKFIGAIGMALGAFGAGLGGGENQALKVRQMMEESVQKDIDAQQKVVDAAGHRTELARNALGEAYRALGNKDAAREAVRGQQLQYAAAQADMMAGQAKDEATKSALLKMKGDLLDEVAMTRAKVAEITNAQVTRDQRFIPAQTVGGGGPMGGFLDVKPGEVVGRPGGGEVAVRGEKAQQEISTRQGFEKDVGNKLRAIAKLDEKASATDIANPYSEYHRERQMLVEQVMPIFSKADQQGVIRESERGPTMAALGTEYSITDKLLGRPTLAGRAADQIGGGSEELINAQHGVGVREVLVRNPKTGNIERKYIPLEQDAKARPDMPSSAKKANP